MSGMGQTVACTGNMNTRTVSGMGQTVVGTGNINSVRYGTN